MKPRALLPLTAIALLATPAFADEPGPKTEEPKPEVATKTEAPKPSAAEKKQGYSIPWVMRPAPAITIVRLDGTQVFQEGGSTQVSVLTGAYRIIPDVAILARAAFVRVSPDGKDSATGFSNPLLAGVFAPEIAPHTRLNLFLGFTFPLGSGGGNTPDLSKTAAVSAGVYARQGMDNALFAMNYFAAIGGASVAYVDRGLTAQVDLTVLELIRAKGSDLEKDDKRTNSMAALHVGYRVLSFLTVSAELHHQRWLSTPTAVDKDSSKRAQSTIGAGVRFNLPIDDHVLRPGLAYFQGLDDPMDGAKMKILMLDVPFVF